jgi:hypothetical protein
MSDTTAQRPDTTELALLIGGIALAAVAYFMPAVVFTGSGNAVHDLSIVEKLPVMSLLALAALGAALVTRIVPALAHLAEHATVAAIILMLVPAVWGFVNAIDAWSALRASILQMAGTRTVRINPGEAHALLAIGAVMIGLSLRVRMKRLAPA